MLVWEEKEWILWRGISEEGRKEGSARAAHEYGRT